MALNISHWVDKQHGTLDRQIFTDTELYKGELEHIFARAWLFIGHEDLIPNPNDFFLNYMGEDPVILTRDSKGKLHAFLNMCMHRGNRIVRADKGNAKSFMCAYHGWTFGNDGRLVSVPGFQEAYYGELPIDKLGLVEVAQLDTYAGFVFATWDSDAPSLEAYLGNFRYYMDIEFNRRDGGVELIGPEKWVIPCNWKNPADNFIGDAHHGYPAHMSSHLVRAKFLGVNAWAVNDERWKRPGFQVSAGNGHGCSAYIAGDDQQYWQTKAQGFAGKVLEYERSIRDEVERRLGAFRARRLQPGHATLFPNMSWLPNKTVRMWHPRGPLQTEVWAFAVVDKAAPQELKRLYKLDYVHMFGPSGTHEQDDMDNWNQSTSSGRATAGRRYPQNISMGVGHESSDPRLPGVPVLNSFAEINQRAFYLRWEEMVNASSWAEIHVDTITVEFEGEASMRG